MEVFADGGDLLIGAFPMQAPLRGTSRTWLSTTVETTARRSKPS